MPVWKEKELTEASDNLTSDSTTKLSKIVQEIDNLKLDDGSCENTVYYTTYCKLAAQLCYKESLHSDMIYYLSECHAASLRQICYRRRVMSTNRDTCESKFNENYTAFRGSYADSKYDGLSKRIEELPKEWTMVQITQQFDCGEGWKLRKPNTVTDQTAIHIVRYNCGSTEVPAHVYIPQLDNSYASESILNLLYSSVLDKSMHSNRNARVKDIKARRLNSCEKLKEITRDIANIWLKEWRCLLLGKIYDKTIEKAIRVAVDDVLASGRMEINESNKELIHQIANGCALLSKLDVENALNELIDDKKRKSLLIERILKLQNEFPNLYYVKRYPVILLVDEKLQCVPWEETLGLRRQPASRLPSVHFVHAFHKMHQDKIIDGNIVINKNMSGYYVINPDLTLRNTERRMLDFLNKRLPNWQGTVGTTSSKEEVTDAVTKHDIFLYCGHGSGVQYIKSSRLFTLNVKAIPLLFGCASIEHKDHGGRVPPTCYANSYMISGSPCVLGMLWSVTSTDTDNMALVLLNHWLPGKPIVIEGLEEFCEDGNYLASTEPELLRAIRLSRNVASFYFNSCAMVVYGLPVIVQ